MQSRKDEKDLPVFIAGGTHAVLHSIALLLGFVAYGLSIFMYVKAQNMLGAAKTSAYYAIAPFIGSFLSFVFLKKKLTYLYMAALVVMIAGTLFIVSDTLEQSED